jgi:hypothetical protein
MLSKHPSSAFDYFTGFKELQMVTAAVILSFIISIVLVLVAISQIDA